MSLKVWINAFIPQTVPGYTQVIRTGEYAGKSAIPLPKMARANPLNTFKDLDAGYLTDQRSFSDLPDSPVRMRSIAEIQLSPRVSVLNANHVSSGTTEVDIATGKKLAFKPANMSGCRFSSLSVSSPVVHSKEYRTPFLGLPYSLAFPVAGPPTYELGVVGQASDPLVSTAAYIDYKGLFRITVHEVPERCFVEFSGLIDAFPAFECYAQLQGRTKCIFTVSPPPGNTVMDLLGSARKRVFGAVSFP